MIDRMVDYLVSKTNEAFRQAVRTLIKDLKTALIREAIRGIAIGIVSGLLAGLVAQYRGPIFAFLSNLVGVHLAQLVISLVTVSAGAFAFWFKKRNQSLYGLVEVVFGMTSGTIVAFNISLRSSSAAQWVTLIGCAYVIARGFGNYDEAKRNNANKVAR